MIGIFVFYFVAFGAGALASSGSFQGFTDSCTIFSQDQRLEWSLGNGEKITNFAVLLKNLSEQNDSTQHLGKISLRQEKRVRELVSFAQGVVIEKIRERSSSLVFRELRKKIASIQVVVPLGIEKSSRCASLEDFADYNVYTHTLTVCPIISHQPLYSQLLVLAHEVAHSVDPCSFHGAVDKVDIAALDRLWEKSPRDLSLPTLNALKDFAAEKSPAYSFAAAATVVPGFDLDTLVKLRTKRVLTIVSKGFTGLSRYPFRKALECLYEKVPFTHTSSRVIDSLSISMTPEQKKLISDWEGCSLRFGSDRYMSQSVEVLADWIALEVVKKYWRKNPSSLRGRELFLEVFGFLASTGCAYDLQANTKLGTPGPESRPDLRRSFQSHIPEYLRFNALVLDHAFLREAMNVSKQSPSISCHE